MATQDKYARLKSDTVLAPLGQALVNLSRANTEQLLSDASQLMRSRRTEAAAILNRLKEMNAIVATQFRPKQDALSLLNLRMICSQLPPSDNFSLPSFIVVSYCWHYPQWPLSRAAKPIAPGWDISRPMIDAVMGVRENDSEGVWLDKLCINQADPVDKEVHIGAMDMIYRSARRVVILLEDVQLNKDEEAAGLAYAAFYADLNRIVKERDLRGKEKSEFIDKWFPSQEKEYHDSGRGHELAAIKSFAMNILEARWYSRAWCAHESRVAPHKKVNNPLFLCFGHDGRVLSFEFRFVFYMSIYLQDKETPLDDEDLVGNGLQMTLNDPEPKTLYQLRMRIQRLHAVYEPDTSALQHLVNILSFGCFLKGDLMSIALNTSGIPLCFDGKLDAPDDIIWIFSLLVLAAGDLVPLIEGAFKVRIPDATAPNGMVISWAPRLTQGTLVNRLPEMSPGTITAAAREYIELD
ncbi:heterokaryon incompatibility protein-domain-containing protein, partial [Apodospora peruviana]